jgi:hypothetical protein
MSMPDFRSYFSLKSLKRLPDHTTMRHRRHAFGLSLVELALVMVIISLALVPVVQMVNGSRSQSGEGTAERVTALKSKEAIVANSLAEEALSGNFSRFNCDGGGNPLAFDPASDLPTSGNSRTYGRCTDTTYATPLYYQWSLVNAPGMPKQNEYYQAALNIYAQPTDGQPTLTLPINFFRNTGSYAQTQQRTGVMLALDVSGSMVWGVSTGFPGGINPTILNPAAGVDYADTYCHGPNCLGSPFMFYRYDRMRFAGNTWGVAFNPASVPGMLPGTKRAWLNMWDNSELDLSYGQSIQPPASPDFSDPDAITPNNEKFPYATATVNDPTWGNGLLGIGNCATAATDNAFWTSNPNLIHTFMPQARTTRYDMANPPEGNFGRDLIVRLCNRKTSTADWNTSLNTAMSRIEAARTGMLSLLISLEANPVVTSSVEMGFVPWSNVANAGYEVPLASAVTVPGVPGLHFRSMRERLLWVNRADPANPNSVLPVPLNTASGATHIRNGLEAAYQRLMGRNYDRRIIVLLTDGAPNPNNGTNTPAAITNYTLNTMGNNAPQNQRVTLFTIGLIQGDPVLLTNMASSTPGGQAFVTNNIQQLRSIFESIAYQIQKLALMDVPSRYDLNF